MIDFEKPQLAVALSWDKLEKYKHYTMEPKLDGIRCLVYKMDDGVKMYTRTGHRLDQKLPHLKAMFESFEGDFILDGEVGYLAKYYYIRPLASRVALPIIDFNRTVRVTGSGDYQAICKQEGDRDQDKIRFFAFDILYNSNSLGNMEYLNDKQIDRTIGTQLTVAAWLDEVPLRLNYQHYLEPVIYFSEWDESVYTAYVEAGGEGMMLKNPRAEYRFASRRANSWYKVKKFETIDVVMIGYTQGQGKYEGQIGAIEFGVYTYDQHGVVDGGIQLGRCSGMDDEMREHVTHWPELYIGKVFELRHFGKTVSGYRFPQFLRWRPDKDAKECTLDGS